MKSKKQIERELYREYTFAKREAYKQFMKNSDKLWHIYQKKLKENGIV